MMWAMRVGVNFFLLLAAVSPIVAKEFHPNVGQLSPEVRYAARAAGVELLANENGNLSLRSLTTATPGAVQLAWMAPSTGQWVAGPAARQVRYCLPGVTAAACVNSSATFSSVRRGDHYPEHKPRLVDPPGRCHGRHSAPTDQFRRIRSPRAPADPGGRAVAKSSL